MDSSSNVYGWVDISIHALREEGDFASMRCAVRASNFYPRPPRGGRRLPPGQKYFYLSISIHALREEGDAVELGQDTGLADFYPRPPRGGRLWHIHR